MPKMYRIPDGRDQVDKRYYQIYFLCPGCKQLHSFNNTWVFNHDYDKPTISPSVLVTWAEGEANIKKVCHSFIKEGMIQFLNDCTHELKGSTVELPEIKIPHE